jgi:hypothetical protein
MPLSSDPLDDLLGLIRAEATGAMSLRMLAVTDRAAPQGVAHQVLLDKLRDALLDLNDAEALLHRSARATDVITAGGLYLHAVQKIANVRWTLTADAALGARR